MPPIPSPRSSLRVAVFGAGAFGGWAALELLRRGASVQLVDAWGPGNVRSSSGGETRVIRATYGSHAIYTRMAARALLRWRAYEERWQHSVFCRTGALWLFPADDPFRERSRAALREVGLVLQDLPVAVAREQYPQICFDDVASVMLEPDAGYLLARRACEHVADRVVKEGGTRVLGAAAAPVRLDGALTSVPLIDGRRIEADAFVFACGPWLPAIFPDVLGSVIQTTRQEVFYFGTPAGDARWHEPQLPVWLDFGAPFIYGIPGNAHRGFKVADDTPGPPMDPTTDERMPSTAALESARRYVARRFPALGTAPVLGGEVCQYESTPDANFVIDRHPAAPNVWIAGGGSGHGFKMGPAVGELVASLVFGEAEPEPSFRIVRFASPPPGGWQPKWA